MVLTMPRVREEESREMLGSLAECFFFYSRREKRNLECRQRDEDFIGCAEGFPAFKCESVMKETVAQEGTEREKRRCQCCREDKEGESLQMSFGMDKFVFVKEQIHNVAGVKGR